MKKPVDTLSGDVMSGEKVLIIDDEQAVLNFLRVMLAQTERYECDTLSDSTRALETLRRGGYDLLLLDMDMPEVRGIDILRFIRDESIDIETIVLTGVDDLDLAVSAMKSGAYDYLRKPVDSDLLLLTMERALERKSMRNEIAELKSGAGWETLQHKQVFENIITGHPKMIRIFRYIEKIAPTGTSVLIQGESGTGKELIARAIHQVSKRKDKPFIAVNAGAFARELFASEFFGHIRGAFSGAVSDKKGFLEEANGGTLFLDEIGELPIELQVKLLRVIQSGEFFRVGSTKPIHTDVRLIAATNKDLWTEIENGNFRKDLFYRLNVNTVSLPPLRERDSDIQLLAGYFLKKFNIENDKAIRRIDGEVIKLLESYSFPGNIRELENLIGSSLVMEQSDTLTSGSLPPEFLKAVGKYEVIRDDTLPDDSPPIPTLLEVEREHIRKTLELTRGNRSMTARLLKITRVTLLAKMKKYQFDTIDFSRGASRGENG